MGQYYSAALTSEQIFSCALVPEYVFWKFSGLLGPEWENEAYIAIQLLKYFRWQSNNSKK